MNRYVKTQLALIEEAQNIIDQAQDCIMTEYALCAKAFNRILGDSGTYCDDYGNVYSYCPTRFEFVWRDKTVSEYCIGSEVQRKRVLVHFPRTHHQSYFAKTIDCNITIGGQVYDSFRQYDELSEFCDDFSANSNCDFYFLYAENYHTTTAEMRKIFDVVDRKLGKFFYCNFVKDAEKQSWVQF